MSTKKKELETSFVYFLFLYSTIIIGADNYRGNVSDLYLTVFFVLDFALDVATFWQVNTSERLM